MSDSEVIDVTDQEESATASSFNVWQCFNVGPRDPKSHKFAHASCKYCPAKYSAPKKVNCETHILSRCPSVPRDVKDQLRQSLCSDKHLPPSLAPPPLRKTDVKRQRILQFSTSDGTPSITRYYDSRAAPAGTHLEELRQAQLLFFVMCKVPFRAAANPYFVAFIQKLRPLFNPAGGLLMFVTSTPGAPTNSLK